MRLALVAPFPPPFVWVVCFFLDLLGALLPGPATAFPGTRAYSPPVHSQFFLCLARHPRPLFCTVCFFPFPCCLLTLCFTPSGGALWFWFFLWSAPPPLCRSASCLVVSSSLQARTSVLYWSSGHGSPRCVFPVPSPPGGWPLAVPGHARLALFSLVTLLSSLSSLPPPSPPLTCRLPALLLLLSCSVCSPLVFPAPGLYLACSHAPLGLRPVLRPVG